jgi:hypothetical protein
LSDEQKQQIYSIQATYRGKIDALDRQIRDLRNKERADLRKVLTDAQRSHLKEIVATRSGEEVDTNPASPDKK